MSCVSFFCAVAASLVSVGIPLVMSDNAIPAHFVIKVLGEYNFLPMLTFQKIMLVRLTNKVRLQANLTL